MSTDTTSDSISRLPAPSLLHPLKNLAEFVLASMRYPCLGDLQQRVPFEAFGTGAPSVSENRRSRKRLQDGHSPDDIGVAIEQGRVRPVEFFIFNTVTKRVDDSLGISSLARSPLRIRLAANKAQPMLHQIASSCPRATGLFPRASACPPWDTNRTSGHNLSADQEEEQYGENKERRRV